MRITNLLLIISFASLIFIPIWIYFILPNLADIPENFSYRADIVSYEEFYDENKGAFSEKIRSDSNFFYEVIGKEDNALLIRNVFNARKPSGDLIVSFDRVYGINPHTGEHLSDKGDLIRTGYLFAPRNANGESFVYWHVNYDDPARMSFVNEEFIHGLKVLHYESNLKADQTKYLTHLKGVPEERGIKTEVEIHTWIEPVSGMMIKYQDIAIAYFYDIKTGKALNPWNKFSNRFATGSISEHVKNAEIMKDTLILYRFLIPIFLALISLSIFSAYLICNSMLKSCKKR